MGTRLCGKMSCMKEISEPFVYCHLHVHEGTIRQAKEAEKKKCSEDVINAPSHYHKGGIDVIGFAEAHYTKDELKGFYRINVIKYVDRYDKKNGLQDLKKAKFYLNKLIELENK
jgi:hypothetical protein